MAPAAGLSVLRRAYMYWSRGGPVGPEVGLSVPRRAYPTQEHTSRARALRAREGNFARRGSSKVDGRPLYAELVHFAPRDFTRGPGRL